MLILGLLGAPALGIKGAALATIGVRGTACVLGLGLLVRRRMVRIEWSGLAKAVGTITRIGWHWGRWKRRSI